MSLKPWWESLENVAYLAKCLAEDDATAEEIVAAVENPARYDDKYQRYRQQDVPKEPAEGLVIYKVVVENVRAAEFYVQAADEDVANRTAQEFAREELHDQDTETRMRIDVHACALPLPPLATVYTPDGVTSTDDDGNL